MTVVILAEERDISADQMVCALRDLDVPVFRVDTARFPAQLSFNAELRGGNWDGELRTPHRTVELAAVRSIWFRSPTTFQFPRELSATERRHAHTEAKLGLGGVLASLPVLWVNHPSRLADASYKPAQLAAAAQHGLHVPPTLVTNEEHAVRRFATESEGGQILTKMLGASSITEEGSRKIAFTRLISSADLMDLRGVGVTAHQFQHWVPKKFDARLISAGERQFAFSIEAGNAESYVDFRYDYSALTYERIDVPTAVRRGVRRFMAHFQLTYGAFDFVVSPDDRWTFLECNPGGQYGWLEAATDAPLTASLAELLAKGVDS